MIKLPRRSSPLRWPLRHHQRDRRAVGVGVIQRHQHRAAEETVTTGLPVEPLSLIARQTLCLAAARVKPSGFTSGMGCSGRPSFGSLRARASQLKTAVVTGDD